MSQSLSSLMMYEFRFLMKCAIIGFPSALKIQIHLTHFELKTELVFFIEYKNNRMVLQFSYDFRRNLILSSYFITWVENLILYHS